MKNDFENLTTILITFLRPEYTKKCVDSLLKNYRGIKIIVGENGDYSEEMEEFLALRGIRYLIFPFDSGVCFGRNRLMDEVETDFVLVGDDDFYYKKKAGVEKMIRFIKKHNEFALIAGRIFEAGKVKDYQGFMTFKEKEKGIEYRKFGETKEVFLKDQNLRYAEVDIAFNYFVARVKDIRPYRWDEKIKVAYEHSDWFIQLKKAGVRVCFTPDAVVVHKPEGVKVDLERYRKFRMRKSDREYFFEKYRLDYFIDMAGRTDKKTIAESSGKYHAKNRVHFNGRTYNRGEIIATKNPDLSLMDPVL